MAQVNFRIDDKVKHDADELFDNLGVSLSAAITIFLKRSISRRGFPFPVVEEPVRETNELYSHDVTRTYVPAVDEKVARRKKLMALAGSWQDDRTAEEIIKDIEGHRTKGREVDL